MSAQAPAMDIVTLRELTDYFKATERTPFRLVQEGKVPAFKVGNSWRSRRLDIDAWLREPTPARRAEAVSNG